MHQRARETPGGSAVAGAGQGWVLGPAPLDPLATVDRSIPAEVSIADLAEYCMMLGDDALVLSLQMSQWTYRSPDLEEDAALARIALDLLGQARVLLHRSTEIEGAGRDEDGLARNRPAEDFKNVRLVEIDCGPGPGGDYAASVARLMVCAVWRLAQFSWLVDMLDPVLAALAGRSLPELRRHRDHAAQWLIKLGDGGSESRQRMTDSLRRVWSVTGELFLAHPTEERLAEQRYAVHPPSLRADVVAALDEVLSVARLDPPEIPVPEQAVAFGGRDGVHTDTLRYLLADMRYVDRAGLSLP